MTMKKFNFKKNIWFIILTIILIVIDQITKYIAVLKLKDQDSFKIIKDVFEFEYVENPGAAWGMLIGQRTFFIILTVILIPILILFVLYLERLIFKSKAGMFTDIKSEKFICKLNVLQYIVVFLISGALGNFIDRLINAYVVDFISFKLIDFPVFNVADCYVTVSTAVLIILMLVFIKSEEFDIIFPTKKHRRDI